jgi:4-hydroxy-3-polyprenylbenzoate decarboxylase
MPLPKRRIIVGISGATGTIYGVRLLELLRELEVESDLVVSSAGDLTRAYDTKLSARELKSPADVVYQPKDVGAAIASESFRTLGMIVAPCSIRTLSEIASGVTSSLLSRAADVSLKERRRLVLMVRETPVLASHLKSMLAVTEAGGIIAPPVPAFYTKPKSLEEMVGQTLARVLDLFDLEVPSAARRGETIGL